MWVECRGNLRKGSTSHNPFVHRLFERKGGMWGLFQNFIFQRSLLSHSVPITAYTHYSWNNNEGRLVTTWCMICRYLSTEGLPTNGLTGQRMNITEAAHRIIVWSTLFQSFLIDNILGRFQEKLTIQASSIIFISGLIKGCCITNAKRTT